MNMQLSFKSRRPLEDVPWLVAMRATLLMLQDHRLSQSEWDFFYFQFLRLRGMKVSESPR